MSTDSVTLVGSAAVGADDVLLVVVGQGWGGWTDERITRGLERMPNDFELTLTEIFPGQANAMVFKPGQDCQVWIGKHRVITGHINRVQPAIAAGQHSISVSGRGMCQDLVDCAAIWPGQQIMASSVLAVAKKLAEPYGISVAGEFGPSVGQADKSALIPILNLMLGETAWDVIERLCRIAGLVAYEQPDGSLLLATNPGDSAERQIRGLAGVNTTAASGFREGVNVEAASATFSDDQRFSEYEIYKFSFDSFLEVGEGQNLIEKATDPGVLRRRKKILIAEMGHSMSLQIARDRVRWEAARRWGRGHAVNITTDSWADSAGQLYTPNTLAAVDIPSLKIEGKSWLITDVTYRKGADGTHCDLTLMPPEAFSVQPTLPPYGIDAAVANLPNGLSRP